YPMSRLRAEASPTDYRPLLPFSLPIRPRPGSTLFPYTTLFRSSDDAEGEHRVGHLAEPGHVRPHHVVIGAAEFGGGLQAGAVDVLHDLGQPLLGVPEAPGVA